MRIKLLLAVAISMFAANALGKDEAPLVQPMSMGDARMDCEALIGEAQRMESLMGGAPETGLDGTQMAAIGTELAQHAALSAGAPRAFGAASAIGGQVGSMFGRASKRKREREAAERAAAEKRWFYVVGLYQGRNCDSAGSD